MQPSKPPAPVRAASRRVASRADDLTSRARCRDLAAQQLSAALPRQQSPAFGRALSAAIPRSVVCFPRQSRVRSCPFRGNPAGDSGGRPSGPAPPQRRGECAAGHGGPRPWLERARASGKAPPKPRPAARGMGSHRRMRQAGRVQCPCCDYPYPYRDYPYPCCDYPYPCCDYPYPYRDYPYPYRDYYAVGRSEGLPRAVDPGSPSDPNSAAHAQHLRLPHPHRDCQWAHPCHICSRTGRTPATSAPGLGSPLPHLHRGWAHPCEAPAATTSAAELGAPGPLPHLHRSPDAVRFACMLRPNRLSRTRARKARWRVASSPLRGLASES